MTLTRKTMPWRLLPVCGMLCLLSVGCQARPLGGVMSDSTFVGAMTSLRRVPAGGLADSLARQRARDSIFKHYRVTPAQLESAAAALAASPDRAAAVWAEIGRREAQPR